MKMLAKITKDMKINTRACMTGLLLTFTAVPVMAGTIVDTKHDFSGSGWSGGEICVACHTPHNSTMATDGPLWNHTLSAETNYSLYSSPTLDATTSQPGGTSKLCLSCHDGTVAYDNSAAGTTMGTSAAAVGSDGLSNDHPVSITFDTALATLDGALHDPAATDVTIGSGTDTKTGSIAAVMLSSGQIQCNTCHDVHNKFTVAPVGTASNKLLRVSKVGSALCLTCHDK